jgi:hypothetical protein
MWFDERVFPKTERTRNSILSLTDSIRELREDRVFGELLKLCAGLDERLKRSSEEEVGLVVDLVRFSNVCLQMTT